MSEKLCRAARQLGISLSDKQIEQFNIYREMLIDYNKVMDLTAVPDDEIETRHFADSISLLASDKIGKEASLIDVGTGAGFPGLPIAISRQDLSVTLLDSLHKRTEFLKAVTTEANILNTQILCMRAEDAAQKVEYRQQYDIAVSRAVAKLSVLSEYCLPFVKEGGYFLAMKGPNAQEELEQAKQALKILGGRVEAVGRMRIENAGHSQTIIVIKKVGQTPTKYPRRAGKPTKNPIE